MRKTIFILFSFFFVNSAFGQNPRDIDELCVINILGANVYENPNFHSKIITKLPVGRTLIIEKLIETEESLYIANGFSLSGNWIKPKEINGFIFSSDLTDKKVEIEVNGDGQTFLNLLGNLTSRTEEKKLIKTENGKFPKYFEYKYYENGTYSYIAWDGCFYHVKEFKNMTFSEVYHQMISNYSGYSNRTKKYWIPEPESVQNNIIKFSGIGATQNLKIEIKKNGTIVVSSNDCT